MRFTMGLLVLIAVASPAFGAPAIFSDSMDSGAAWSIRQTSDATATFGFDYSAMGIPASPNGGGSTVGLRMTANESAGAVNEVSAVADGLALPAQYTVQFDLWINANGPFPGGGSGSTEYIGGGVGLNGTEAGRDGANLMIDGEGGSTYDWRLNKDKGLQYPASAQYNPQIASLNNTDVFLSAQFPGQTAPAFQQTNYAQQTGQLSDGTIGFAWHTMKIIVDSTGIGSGVTQDPGVARFELDGLWIGTIDNSNGGTVVDMTGGVGVMYADIFSSVSDNPELSFGVIDNFVVTPEPGSLALLALGGLALLRRKA